MRKLIDQGTGSTIYTLCVTRPQIEKIQLLNERAGEARPIGGNYDAVQIVDEDDSSADTILGLWFGMTIGVLPDGSSHS